jgi:hypothetical protein
MINTEKLIFFDKVCPENIKILTGTFKSWDSKVGIVTGYALDGRGSEIESR